MPAIQRARPCLLCRAIFQALNSPETLLDGAICRLATPTLDLGPKGAMTPTAQCSGWLPVTMDKQAPGFLFHNGATAVSFSALHICPARKAAFGMIFNNGVAGNLWANTKLNWSNPLQKAHEISAHTRCGIRAVFAVTNIGLRRFAAVCVWCSIGAVALLSSLLSS